MGNGITFRRDLETEDDIRAALVMLSDSLSYKLRKRDLKGNIIKIDIKDTKLRKITRQKKLDYHTYLKSDIVKESLKLLTANWETGNPIRHITVTVSGFEDDEKSEQMSLFGTKNKSSEKTYHMEKSIDDIRSRFGMQAISFGSNVDCDIVRNHKKDNDNED